MEYVKVYIMTTVFLFFVLAIFPSISVTVNLGPNVCQEMWNKAANNLKIPSELKVNTATPSTSLFQLTPPGKAKIGKDEFKFFEDLLASHARGSSTLTPFDKSSLEDRFLTEIGKPNGPIEVALKYLKGKGKLPSVPDLKYFYSNTLKIMWFAMYTKGKGKMKLPHNGFEHTFVGDKINTEFKGFHNWYQFFLEQNKSKIKDVAVKIPIQFLARTEPAFMSALTFQWDGATKRFACGSSLFVGTSPAFEIALYSVCFLEYPGQECGCNIGKSLVKVQTYAASPPQHVATAYPLEVSFPPGRCGIAKNDRTDCGWIGIDKKGCENRCCCWQQEVGKYDTPWPWCFYPAGHKCEGINPKNRKDCGYLQIQRTECEAKGCCFDSHVPNVPFCFFGEYK